MRGLLSESDGEENLFSISELFHENTKIYQLGKENEILFDEIYREVYSKAFKKYPAAKKVELSKNFSDSHLFVEKGIRERRSTRDFSGGFMNLDQLSKILCLSYGITGSLKLGPENALYLRATPSGGGLYPLEVYPILFKVKGIEPGVYHHNIKENSLEFLRGGDFCQDVYKFCLGQDMVLSSSLVLMISAIFQRSKHKYGERGYRYILLEAGHLAQNIYLITMTLNLGCVTIGGFNDDAFNELLELDGVEESTLYLAVIGVK